MDLQTRKLALIQEFLKIQSEDVLSRLEKILNKEKNKTQHSDLTPMSIEELNSRIDQSMNDSKDGKLIESKDLKSIIDQWS
jgi:chemotaxis protein CheY-P-specific phosphatase CheC